MRHTLLYLMEDIWCIRLPRFSAQYFTTPSGPQAARKTLPRRLDELIVSLRRGFPSLSLDIGAESDVVAQSLLLLSLFHYLIAQNARQRAGIQLEAYPRYHERDINFVTPRWHRLLSPVPEARWRHLPWSSQSLAIDSSPPDEDGLFRRQIPELLISAVAIPPDYWYQSARLISTYSRFPVDYLFLFWIIGDLKQPNISIVRAINTHFERFIS